MGTSRLAAAALIGLVIGPVPGLTGLRVITPRVQLGLGAPLGEITSVGEADSALEKHLIWSASDQKSTMRLRLHAVRIDRGRVTSSRQSLPVTPPPRPQRVVRSLDRAGWELIFPDCCFHPTDPPMSVRALSGTRHLDRENLERAIAAVVTEGAIGAELGVEPAVRLDWGRHVVLILSATSDEPVAVRPLFLVLERR